MNNAYWLAKVCEQIEEDIEGYSKGIIDNLFTRYQQALARRNISDVPLIAVRDLIKGNTHIDSRLRTAQVNLSELMLNLHTMYDGSIRVMETAEVRAPKGKFSLTLGVTAFDFNKSRPGWGSLACSYLRGEFSSRAEEFRFSGYLGEDLTLPLIPLREELDPERQLIFSELHKGASPIFLAIESKRRQENLSPPEYVNRATNAVKRFYDQLRT